MSKRSAANFNGRLTSFAHGLAQDLASSLAEFLAPTVPTGVANGQFKKYSDKNAFQVYDTARAVGGPATRIKFEAEDPFYNCKPQALEITVDDAERDAAGDVPGAQHALDEAKVSTLVTDASISHEVKVLAAAKGLTAVATKGVWSDVTVDPVKEINDQIVAIATATGRMPNAIAFGIGAWQAFIDHPKVHERQPGAALIGVTTSQAAGMLINPAIEIKVGVLSQDQTKFGKAKDAKNIVGAEVFIFHRSPNPTIYDPSWMKTFMVRKGGVQSVRTYREEPFNDVHLVDWTEDIQRIADDCARRISVS